VPLCKVAGRYGPAVSRIESTKQGSLGAAKRVSRLDSQPPSQEDAIGAKTARLDERGPSSGSVGKVHVVFHDEHAVPRGVLEEPPKSHAVGAETFPLRMVAIPARYHATAGPARHAHLSKLALYLPATVGPVGKIEEQDAVDSMQPAPSSAAGDPCCATQQESYQSRESEEQSPARSQVRRCPRSQYCGKMQYRRNQFSRGGGSGRDSGLFMPPPQPRPVDMPTREEQQQSRKRGLRRRTMKLRKDLPAWLGGDVPESVHATMYEPMRIDADVEGERVAAEREAQEQGGIWAGRVVRDRARPLSQRSGVVDGVLFNTANELDSQQTARESRKRERQQEAKARQRQQARDPVRDQVRQFARGATENAVAQH